MTPTCFLHSYSVQLPELGCYGHKEYSAGVKNYGKKDPKELFDVYCFANELEGMYMHAHAHTHTCAHMHTYSKNRHSFQFLLLLLHHFPLQHKWNFIFFNLCLFFICGYVFFSRFQQLCYKCNDFCNSSCLKMCWKLKKTTFTIKLFTL